MIALLALLLACGGSEPELASRKEALELWRQGKERLEEGKAREAEERFSRALDVRPKDPVLQSWQAHALARQGKLEEAVAVLDVVLARYPNFAEARYNRAAYLARLGDLDASAADLKRALRDGARRSREVLDDPDFQPHLDHPAFSFLPDQALSVAVDAPDGPLFAGSQAQVRLRVLGTEGAPVQVTAAEASGPIRLSAATEDEIATSEGPGRELTWTFEVAGPGSIRLGPLKVRAGGHEADAGTVTIEAVAQPGRTTPDVPPLTLQTPTEVGGELALPSATWSDGALLVKTAHADRVVVEPAPTALPSQWELRDLGRTQWVVYRYALPARPERVRILRGGRAILDAPPQDPEP